MEKLLIPYLNITTRKDLYAFCKEQRIMIYEFEEIFHSVIRTLEHSTDSTRKQKVPIHMNVDFLLKSDDFWGETYTRIRESKITEKISLFQGHVYRYVNESGEKRAEFSLQKIGEDFPYQFNQELRL